MADLLKLMEEIFTLNSNVKSLKEQVNRLEIKSEKLLERLIKLESSKNEILLQAENTAIKGVSQVNLHLMERIINLENHIGLKPANKKRKLLKS
jgi:hypothetical protein